MIACNIGVKVSVTRVSVTSNTMDKINKPCSFLNGINYATLENSIVRNTIKARLKVLNIKKQFNITIRCNKTYTIKQVI